MKARRLLSLLFLAAMSGGCQQLRQPSRSAGMTVPRPADRSYTIWADPTERYIEAEGFSLPLTKGVFLAKRFVSPASGRSLQGKLFLIDMDFQKQRRLKISLCSWKGGKVSDTGRVIEATTPVTIGARAKEERNESKYYEFPFLLSCQIEKGKTYWLVLESDPGEIWTPGTNYIDFLAKSTKPNENNVIHMSKDAITLILPIGRVLKQMDETKGSHSPRKNSESLGKYPINCTDYDFAFELKLIE
jgi:hypothetical protein